MSPPRESNSPIEVKGELRIGGNSPERLPGVEALVSVRGSEPTVIVAIVLESTTTWWLELSHDAAAFLAGTLAEAAGVTFG